MSPEELDAMYHAFDLVFEGYQVTVTALGFVTRAIYVLCAVVGLNGLALTFALRELRKVLVDGPAKPFWAEPKPAGGRVVPILKDKPRGTQVSED